MDKALELKLVNEFPDFFVDYHKSPRESCLGRGIECGNGWFDLIHNTCECISRLFPQYRQGFKFTQIKEKFGLLCMNVSGGDIDTIHGVLNYAARMSKNTCEECGTNNDVELKGNSWLRTLCVKCRQENKSAN